MMKREDDLGVLCLEKHWSNIPREVCEEELLKARKINHEYLISGAASSSSSSSSSLRVTSIDLNELPLADDEEQLEAKREDPNGASASSSSSCLRNNIDLNEPPSVSEREEPPQSPNRCSSTLHGPSSPPSSNKRALVRKGRSSGRLTKAKKPRPKAALEAGDARLVFEKTLSESDVNRGQSRFLIPFNQLKRNDFLTQAESSSLEQEEDEEGEKPGVDVILVNQRSETWDLVLRRYVMKKKNSDKVTLNYALNGGWNDVVKGNGLKAKDEISLSAFRSDGVLCFALTTDHPPTTGQSSSSAIS